MSVRIHTYWHILPLGFAYSALGRKTKINNMKENRIFNNIAVRSIHTYLKSNEQLAQRKIKFMLFLANSYSVFTVISKFQS